MMAYGQEYSQDNIKNLLAQYNQLLDPYYQEQQRKAKHIGSNSIGGLSSSGYAKGLIDLGAQRAGDVGKYGLNLATQGIEAARQERLTAEDRANANRYQDASFLGKLDGQDTLQGRQFNEGVRQFDTGQQNWLKGYGLQERGQNFTEEMGRANLGETKRQFDTGQGNWLKNYGLQDRSQTLAEQNAATQVNQFDKTFGENKRQFDTGQQNWSQNFNEGQRQFNVGQSGYVSPGVATLGRQQWETSQSGYLPTGQATFAREAYNAEAPSRQAALQQSWLPWVTQGYVNEAYPGIGVTTEQSLNPEWQTAAAYGFSNPYEMSLYAETNPDEFKKIVASKKK